jgi:hypothetical protein
MPKKKKLQLGSLKVKSFVTQLGEDAKKAKGGESENTLCIDTCMFCPSNTCDTCDTCDTCMQSCYGTCGGSCDTGCGTYLSDCTCPETCITIPSCPQIICTG